MTTPSYAELVAAVRQESEALLAAARTDLDAPVPTCGDWQLADLLAHVTGVFTWVSAILLDRAPDRPLRMEEPTPAEPAGAFENALEELIGVLGDADAETPAWNWSGDNLTASFWARRMAHEVAVHRFDAQRAQGVAQPIDPELATDGLDELVDLIVPRVAKRRTGGTPPDGTYLFCATDEGEWPLRVEDGALSRLELARDPDVTVRGTASALLLAAYGRVPWSSLEVDGDATLLDGWSAGFRF